MIPALTTLSVFEFDSFKTKSWVFSQMATAHLSLRRLNHLNWYKLLGTGMGEGFDPKPNWSRWAILATWQTRQAFDQALLIRSPFSQWVKKSSKSIHFRMHPIQVRGDSWSGVNPFGNPEACETIIEPIAVLTRATIKISKMRQFWSQVPDINPDIRASADHIIYKVGLGEMPFLHQVTFSIWDKIEAMQAFAYGCKAHARAIQSARSDSYFSDQLFVRFKLESETLKNGVFT